MQSSFKDFIDLNVTQKIQFLFQNQMTKPTLTMSMIATGTCILIPIVTRSYLMTIVTLAVLAGIYLLTIASVSTTICRQTLRELGMNVNLLNSVPQQYYQQVNQVQHAPTQQVQYVPQQQVQYAPQKQVQYTPQIQQAYAQAQQVRTAMLTQQEEEALLDKLLLIQKVAEALNEKNGYRK